MLTDNWWNRVVWETWLQIKAFYLLPCPIFTPTGTGNGWRECISRVLHLVVRGVPSFFLPREHMPWVPGSGLCPGDLPQTSGLGMFQALLTAFQRLTFPADSTSWRNRYIEFWAQWGQLQASDRSVSQWKIPQKSAPKKMQAPGISGHSGLPT